MFKQIWKIQMGVILKVQVTFFSFISFFAFIWSSLLAEINALSEKIKIKNSLCIKNLNIYKHIRKLFYFD